MIHYFNPGHEAAVLNASPYYMPPANVVLMQQELAFLVTWYAQKGDFVFTRNEDIESFCNYLKNNLGINIHPFNENDIPNLREVLDNQKVSLWGISRQAIHTFEEINKKYDLNMMAPQWNEEYKELCSRLTARNVLKELINNIPQIDKNIIPVVCENLDQIEESVSNNDYQLIAKAPYSSSGRGLLWLPIEGLTRTERQILNGIFKKQKFVTLESALNKKIDFAMEFMIDEQMNVSYEGLSVFKTNEKGAYLGNFLDNQNSLLKMITTHIDENLLLETRKNLLVQIKEKIAPYCHGCLGIDMMIYEKEGQYCFHPCLEINMRYNMGYLCIKLFEKYISANSEGDFYIDFSSKPNVIFENNKRMTDSFPTSFKDNKLQKGYMTLCPVNEKSHYHAYVIVREKK